MALQQAFPVEDGTAHAWDLRRNTNAATSGATGIARPLDLQVQALAVAGDSVRIMPGSGTIENTYPGAINESYSVAVDAADGDAIVPIPATGSSGPATRYVGIKIEDPQYGGQNSNGKYCAPVVLNALPAPGSYPFLPLARINQPASTATITQDMIEDLREMAQPLSRVRQLAYSLVSGDGEDVLTATGVDGEYFPSIVGRWDVPVPSWATRVYIIATWGQVFIPDGNVTGDLWVQIGDNNASYKFSTQKTRYDTQSLTTNSRLTFVMADDKSVPTDIRGQVVRFGMRGRVEQVLAGTDPNIRLNWGSSVALQLQFVAAPDVVQAP